MSVLLPILSSWLGLTAIDLTRIIETAPRRYKTFYVRKRSGGVREIAQPAREVKALQRVLVEQFLRQLPVHPAATAYKPGATIAKNALAHSGHTPLLKMDFQDFFPSIHASDWANYCKQYGLFDDEDLRLTQNILFRKSTGEKTLKLSIGAPSSPLVSNVLLHSFDDIIQQQAEKRGISYTRYADDMTFSGQRIGMLKDMIAVVRETARLIKSPKLVINEEKTIFATTANRRTVTGVTLTNSGKISLGHERKRVISAKVHSAKSGKLSKREMAELAGILSFANVVEPDFLLRLKSKYGPEIVKQIQTAPRVKRRGRFEV